MINTKFMNKINKILIFTLIAGFAFNTNAQKVSLGVATSATVIEPLTLGTVVAMNFGSMSVNGTAGTLILSTAGGRTATDGVNIITPGNATDVSFGGITVDGQNDAAYTLTIKETTMLRLDGNSETLVTGDKVLPLSAFTLSNNGTAVSTSTTSASFALDTFTGAKAVYANQALTNAGAGVLKIGATISLDADQSVGGYAGELTIEVAYE